MRIAKFNQVIEIAFGDDDSKRIALEMGIEYVLADIFVQSIIQKGFSNIIVHDVDFYKDERIKSRQYKGESLYGKKLITFRNGGIGDLIFQLPAIKELKDVYNDNVKITICCNEQYIDIFNTLSYVDIALTLPLKLDVLLEHDYYVNFEGLIEHNPRAEEINAYDLHSEKFYVKPKSNIPQLETNPEKDIIVLKQIDSLKINIVIAFQASAYIRSINPDTYANFIAYVGKANPNVKFYIVGTKNQSKNIDALIDAVKKQANVHNCINWSKKYNDLGIAMSLIKYSNCVIGPDSGLLHIAGGLNIPIIGLYGPFHSKLRLKYYKNAIGLDSMSDCQYGERSSLKSCFQHGTGSCIAAIKNDEIFSPCMNLFTPNIIYDKLKELKII